MKAKNENYKVVRNHCGSKNYVVIRNPDRGTMTKREAHRKARRLNASHDYCSL